MRIFQWIVKQTSCDKPCRMGHVHHEYCTDLIGDTAHTCIVPFTGIGTCPADYKRWALTQCHFLHLVVIHKSIVLTYIILKGLEHQAGEIDRAAMRQMSAMR